MLSLCLTLMLWIVLFILKLCWVYIPSIFSLSLIAWLLDIIPYIGPLIAWVPIAILAWIHNWIRWFFIIWTLFVVIQWIQENVITPILMWKQLGVNSLLILICALLWAIVMWFWWIVLSVPLAVVIGLFIDDENKWEDE
jgi:predicted PurR-regulated permease PerM